MNLEYYKKFLLLLSSENDGEVIAAARAIGRKLKADGHDWHWLVSQFGTMTKPNKQATQTPAPHRPTYRDNMFEGDVFGMFNDAVKRAEKSGKWRPSGSAWGRKK